MKMLVSLAVCAASLICAPVASAQDKTATERAAAVTYLEDTRQAFLRAIAGVNEAQWTFKAGADRWSIAEVAEHIALSEETILGMIQTKMLAAPPPAGPGITDEKLIAGITDRSQKATAPEMLKPANKWLNKEALAKDFNAARDKTIAWLKSTKEDLRAHAAPHPAFGPLDVHQWVLLIAGHSARHTAQIEEVKTQNGYPK